MKNLYPTFAATDYEQALADFDFAIELDPANALIYYNRGVTYYDLQKYDRALKDYDRAIELEPELWHAHLNKGITLANTGRLQESLLYFEQAARLGNTTGAQFAAQVRQMLGR